MGHCYQLILLRHTTKGLKYQIYVVTMPVADPKGAKFQRKLHEIVRIWVTGGAALLDAPLRLQKKFIPGKKHLHLAVLLWTGCLTGFLYFLTNKEVDIRKWTDCKLFYFMFRFGRHYSSMLLVLMSVEKCFAIYFPLKSKSVCTIRTAKWATGFVGVILGSYNLVYFFVVKWLYSKSSGRSPLCFK